MKNLRATLVISVKLVLGLMVCSISFTSSSHGLDQLEEGALLENQGYCCFIKSVITDFTGVEEELFDNCHVQSYKNGMRIQASLVVTNGVMCSSISRKKV